MRIAEPTRMPLAGLSGQTMCSPKYRVPEVAAQFMAPPPEAMLDTLVREGRLTSTEAEAAKYAPVAEDVAAEADSGGHTDNRPLAVLLPLLLRERDRAAARFRGAHAIRIGAAGGLGTPAAVAAAFAMGAAYVLTGTVNQTARESGLSETGKLMLREASMADVAMAPSADMFEFGVKVQVLRKGSLYSQKAARLFEPLSKLPGDRRNPVGRPSERLSVKFSGAVWRMWKPRFHDFFDEESGGVAARRGRRASQDGFDFSMVPGDVQTGGQSPASRTGASTTRFGSEPAIGAFNEWVSGTVSGGTEGSQRGTDRPEPAGRRGDRHPRTTGAGAWRRCAGVCFQSPSEAARVTRSTRIPHRSDRNVHAFPRQHGAGRILADDRQRPGLSDGRAREPLADRGLLRSGPGQAGQDICAARGFSFAGFL